MTGVRSTVTLTPFTDVHCGSCHWIPLNPPRPHQAAIRHAEQHPGHVTYVTQRHERTYVLPLADTGPSEGNTTGPDGVTFPTVSRNPRHAARDRTTSRRRSTRTANTTNSRDGEA